MNGFKAIAYNLNDTAVKLETRVDTENRGKGPYKKVHELIDDGNWGDNMKLCDAEKRRSSNYMGFSNCYNQGK